VWDKPTRLSIFSAIYEILFWRSQGFELKQEISIVRKDLSWSFIFENLKFESKPDINSLDLIIDSFYKSEGEYTILLSKYLNSWDKTYSIVKACLFTFLLELNSTKELNNSQDISGYYREIITRYIRLSEDYIGGQNVGLVHAVLSKIIS
jgi:transcription termination factor NusB